MKPTIWVCAACGKYAKQRMDVGDASCWMHSVECYTNSLVFGPKDRVKQARAVLDVV